MTRHARHSARMFEKRRLHSVHFVRFAAATVVAIAHIMQQWNIPITVGGAGVDMFFVISGLVIGLAFRSNDTARVFAIKRVIRVMPLYWLATMLFIGFQYYAWREVPSTEHVVRSMFLWPVFGTKWYPLYFPAWTLQFEMFFYLVASLFLLVARPYAAILCLTLFAYLASCNIPVPGAPKGVLFETSFLVEFCAGMLIAEAIRREIYVRRKAGVLLIAIAIVIFSQNYQQFLARPMCWGVPSVMLIVGLLSFENAGWLRNRFVVLGGEASYAMYLTHVTVVEFLSEAFKWWSIPAREYPIIYAGVLFVAVLSSAAIVHIWIERPLLGFLRRQLLQDKNILASQSA